jgi:hypothetical protein
MGGKIIFLYWPSQSIIFLSIGQLVREEIFANVQESNGESTSKLRFQVHFYGPMLTWLSQSRVDF